MEIYLLIGGILHIALAIFHILFWKLFAWDRQLVKLNPINKGAMQAMNIALIVLFLFFAFLSLFLQEELQSSKLGIYILGFISLFWFIRMIVQLILFKNDNFKKSLFFGTCNALFIVYGFATSHLINT